MTDRNNNATLLAEGAISDEKKFGELLAMLETGGRRARQHAASAIYVIAKTEPKMLVDHIDVLVDSLNRPEAQTRWELLETMTLLVDHDARTCAKAIPEAESSLFDEDSGPVRLGSMKFLCKLGATTANRSEKVWPLIDEAIQCYHGDLEFNDMLTALVNFSKGKLSDEVKVEFAERMHFDAMNGKGTLKKRAQAILENLE